MCVAVLESVSQVLAAVVSYALPHTWYTRYVEVQIQYSGEIITTCYTKHSKHSIAIRHHGSQYLRNTLSKTATHIKANYALINKHANTILLYFLQIQPMK